MGLWPLARSSICDVALAAEIHHRAFDSLAGGVTPKFQIEIRPDIMDEQDGPTLRYSLQGLHGSAIILPHQRVAHPDKLLLEERYERFRAAS